MKKTIEVGKVYAKEELEQLCNEKKEKLLKEYDANAKGSDELIRQYRKNAEESMDVISKRFIEENETRRIDSESASSEQLMDKEQVLMDYCTVGMRVSTKE